MFRPAGAKRRAGALYALHKLVCRLSRCRKGPQEQGANFMILSWILSKIRNYRRYRETVAELSRLSDRELDDLGISRFEIEAVARTSVQA
jgi:uncharacterized protein YjiS (DUF1127 family)